MQLGNSKRECHPVDLTRPYAVQDERKSWLIKTPGRTASRRNIGAPNVRLHDEIGHTKVKVQYTLIQRVDPRRTAYLPGDWPERCVVVMSRNRILSGREEGTTQSDELSMQKDDSCGVVGIALGRFETCH